MATILLHDRKGKVVASALVDDEDFAALSEYHWCRHSRGYAKRRVQGNVQILMHRQIMGDAPADGLEVDHINRCKLDNRRSNLRWVTRSENVRNTGIRPDSGTRERHVHRHVSRRTGKVRYSITRTIAPGKTVACPGRYDTLAEAVVARDAIYGKAG